jgi:CTP synthase (UTP-ammonia lyase)
VLGIEDAQHAEYDPYASRLILTPFACSPAGQTMPVTLAPESKVASLYGRTQVSERYYCNFGLNPAYRRPLEEAGLRFTGWDADGDVRVLELPAHPFYVGTLFVPQQRSTPDEPHPIVLGLVEAARRGSSPLTGEVARRAGAAGGYDAGSTR